MDRGHISDARLASLASRIQADQSLPGKRKGGTGRFGHMVTAPVAGCGFHWSLMGHAFNLTISSSVVSSPG